jgi:hypothetical protein
MLAKKNQERKARNATREVMLVYEHIGDTRKKKFRKGKPKKDTTVNQQVEPDFLLATDIESPLPRRTKCPFLGRFLPSWKTNHDHWDGNVYDNLNVSGSDGSINLLAVALQEPSHEGCFPQLATLSVTGLIYLFSGDEDEMEEDQLDKRIQLKTDMLASLEEAVSNLTTSSQEKLKLQEETDALLAKKNKLTREVSSCMKSYTNMVETVEKKKKAIEILKREILALGEKRDKLRVEVAKYAEMKEAMETIQERIDHDEKAAASLEVKVKKLRDIKETVKRDHDHWERLCLEKQEKYDELVVKSSALSQQVRVNVQQKTTPNKVTLKCTPLTKMDSNDTASINSTPMSTSSSSGCSGKKGKPVKRSVFFFLC